MLLTIARATRVLRHQAEDGWWEIVLCDPDPRLFPHVVSCCGWTEQSAQAVRRREVPGGIVPFIIDFGPSFRLSDPDARSEWRLHRHGFIAGVHESYALTEAIGASCGMQYNLTPLGGYLLFGLSMSTIVNRTVGLGDLFGAEAGRLVDRLYDAPAWEMRFAILDDFVARRLDAARHAHDLRPGVSWAWQQLTRSAGRVDIGRLSTELGCSRKHLIAQFREQVGVPPKTMARILRFERAVKLLKGEAVPNGADVAFRCGYFDQAHLIKDFREFAGTTPTEFLRRRVPDLDAVSD
jgi:AraC-like DNA-binding protein